MEEQQLLSTEDNVSIRTSDSPKEQPVSEESQSFVTLKNKFEGIFAFYV